MSGKPIAARLSNDEEKVLQELKKKYNLKSNSLALRKAVQMAAMQQKTSDLKAATNGNYEPSVREKLEQSDEFKQILGLFDDVHEQQAALLWSITQALNDQKSLVALLQNDMSITAELATFKHNLHQLHDFVAKSSVWLKDAESRRIK